MFTSAVRLTHRRPASNRRFVRRRVVLVLAPWAFGFTAASACLNIALQTVYGDGYSIGEGTVDAVQILVAGKLPSVAKAAADVAAKEGNALWKLSASIGGAIGSEVGNVYSLIGDGGDML